MVKEPLLGSGGALPRYRRDSFEQVKAGLYVQELFSLSNTKSAPSIAVSGTPYVPRRNRSFCLTENGSSLKLGREEEEERVIVGQIVMSLSTGNARKERIYKKGNQDR